MKGVTYLTEIDIIITEMTDEEYLKVLIIKNICNKLS